MPFKKGEVLIILAKDEDQWWTAQNSKGAKGSVPVPYIVPVGEVIFKKTSACYLCSLFFFLCLDPGFDSWVTCWPPLISNSPFIRVESQVLTSLIEIEKMKKMVIICYPVPILFTRILSLNFLIDRIHLVNYFVLIKIA